MKFNKTLDAHESVGSYWFKEYPCGIKHLLINTHIKGADWDQRNNNNYVIEGVDLNIPELPDYYSHHTMTTLQEKDQLSFYWIPFELTMEGPMLQRYLERKANIQKANILPLLTIGDLRKIVELTSDLPEDRLIISQAILNDGVVWNLPATFCITAPQSNLSVIALEALPKQN